jgi:hypothetical protein
MHHTIIVTRISLWLRLRQNHATTIKSHANFSYPHNLVIKLVYKLLRSFFNCLILVSFCLYFGFETYAPFACRGHYGVLVDVHYYRACYCEIAETLVHIFALGH